MAGALAFAAAAERGHVQEPHPQRQGGDGEQDELGVHRGSPLRCVGGAGGVPGLIACGLPSGVTLRVPFGAADRLTPGEALFVAFTVTLLVDAAGEPLTRLVADRR